jgi:hypothetical protein
MIKVSEATCHPETCLDVEGLENHIANVNPVGGTTRWRVDCDGCATCIRIRDTKEEALAVAKEHVQMTSDEYWEGRDAS